MMLRRRMHSRQTKRTTPAGDISKVGRVLEQKYINYNFSKKLRKRTFKLKEALLGDEEGPTHKEGRESHKLQMKSEDLKILMRRKNLTNLVMKENITTSMRRENPNNNKVVIYTNLERSELWTVHKQDNTPLSNDTPQQY